MDDIKKRIIAKEVEDLVISKDAFGPWSFSKLKVLQQCPLKFYLQYILKIKITDGTPSLITTVGKAVHRILELMIIGKSIGDSFKAAKKEFVGSTLSEAEWNTQVATTELNVMEFRQRLDDFEKKFPVKRYIQELKVGITQQYTPTGFFSDDVYWRGVIDLGMQLESNDLIVLDHKTGAPSEMGIRNFQSQLDSYKVLFHHGVEPVNGAQAGVHFVKDGKVVLDNYTDKLEIEGRLVQELEFFLIAAVDKLKDIGYFKHIRGGYCKWCDYNEDCKKGELLDAEHKTKRFFPIKKIE